MVEHGQAGVRADHATSSYQIFFGTSANAVKTQSWIAVSVYVLVAIAKGKRLDVSAFWPIGTFLYYTEQAKSTAGTGMKKLSQLRHLYH